MLDEYTIALIRALSKHVKEKKWNLGVVVGRGPASVSDHTDGAFESMRAQGLLPCGWYGCNPRQRHIELDIGGLTITAFETEKP